MRHHRIATSLIAAIGLIPITASCAAQPAPAAPGAPGGDDGPAVTVYSSADPAGFDPQQFIAQQRMGYNPMFAWQVPGFGVVKEVRTLSMKTGFNELRFTDVAQFIDPTTVSFTDLTDPKGTAVLEQNFEFDLVNPEKLYEKYIDREILIEVTKDAQSATIQGKVLAVNAGMFIIQTSSGLEFVPQGDTRIKLPPLPMEGLVTKPTLVWKVQAKQAGDHKVRTTYQTNGITWRADYNLILNADDTKADLGAWVSLMNLTGAAYENAKLKLIAGDVQRIQPQGGYAGGYPFASSRAVNGAEQLGFEEKAFFEYHLYTLPRRTDIRANQTQQITLFPTATDVRVEKVMVYYGTPDAAQWGFFPNPQLDAGFGNQSNPKVDVYVRFQNEKENALGIPLPRGKVRVYKSDGDEAPGAGDPSGGGLEFVGEDLIDHTPKDEEVLVKVGQAFDVVGERTQTNFTIDTTRKVMTESFRIEIRNHKEDAINVVIKENLYRWVQWEIVEKSGEFEKIDARTIHFEVEVPADGEKTVTYTVMYTW